MARIVLAEDDATMVHLLRTLLQMDGHEVTTVDGDGDVGAAVTALSPDVLLLDTVFGTQSGLELVAQIRRSENGRKAYILMMSGLSLKDEALQSGADDFLLKPFMPEELIGLLRLHAPANS
jgi:DNA-binding response OmpR family regulator